MSSHGVTGTDIMQVEAVFSQVPGLPPGVTNAVFADAVGWPGPKGPGKGPDWDKMRKLGIALSVVKVVANYYADQVPRISNSMSHIPYAMISYCDG